MNAVLVEKMWLSDRLTPNEVKRIVDHIAVTLGTFDDDAVDGLMTRTTNVFKENGVPEGVALLGAYTYHVRLERDGLICR